MFYLNCKCFLEFMGADGLFPTVVLVYIHLLTDHRKLPWQVSVNLFPGLRDIYFNNLWISRQSETKSPELNVSVELIFPISNVHRKVNVALTSCGISCFFKMFVIFVNCCSLC